MFMKQIDLRRFDLNLLVVFDALMVELSVTRAAERLGRTQSTVSHSLSRLRRELGDPLLVKGGVRMQPTAFALDLIEQARPILRSLQRALSPRYAFDSATSQRVFRIGAPDFATSLYVRLLESLRSEAPGVSVEWTTARHPMLLDVAEGQIDVAVAPAQVRPPRGVAAQAVGAVRWRCFGRRDHPAFSQWGVEAWSHWPHIAPHIDDRLTNPVTVAASHAGLQRTVAGRVPHFAAIAPVLAATDLLATLPSIAMDNALQPYRLDHRDVPFPIAPIPFAMLWSTGRQADPEIAWFRQRLRPIVTSTFGELAG